MSELTSLPSLPDFDGRPQRARPTPDRHRHFWSPSQRRALALFTLLAAGALAIARWSRPAILPDPLPPEPARFAELKDRLDPNTATAAELSVLPGIGPAKADAIVQFRAGRPFPAFRKADDLMDVYGIGEATVQKLEHYLHFAEPPPAPQP